MAMLTPTTLNVNAFDSSSSNIFRFTVNGGNQVVKNTIRIKDNETDEIIYTNTVETYQFQQEVPPNTLTNGKQYNVSFKTYSTTNEESEYSNETPFWCYTTPTIELNINNNDIIRNSQFTFIAKYNQQEGELLDYGIFSIYNASRVLISTSNNLTNISTPPLELSYMYQGFEDNSVYYISFRAISINGTITQTDLIPFNIKYYAPSLFSTLELTPHCNDGYIGIKSNIISIIGEPNHIPYYGEENTAIELINCNFVINGYGNKNVVWRKGFTVPTDFVMKCWFTPCEDTTFMILGDNDIKIDFVRALDYDYVNIITKNGGVITSNGIDKINTRTKCFLWIKVVNGVWEVKLDALDRSETVFRYNDDDNYSYNTLLDKAYVGEDGATKDDFVVPEQNLVKLDNTFKRVLISNGIFRRLYFSSNTEMEYSTEEKSEWDYNTIFNCDFNGGLNGGNIEEKLKTIQGLRIKRRDENTLNWITIYEHLVSDESDFNISIRDSFVPSGVKQYYALVPLMQDSSEGEYIISDVVAKWNGTFISDKDKIFKLYSSVSFGSLTNNIQVGTVLPIGKKYPIIIRNADTNYISSSLSGALYGYNFEKTRRIDRADVVKQVNNIKDFLTDGKSKMITDWNGNIYLIQVVGTPTIDLNAFYTNGIATVSFDWVEQGKYNNEEDLRENGLN